MTSFEKCSTILLNHWTSPTKGGTDYYGITRDRIDKGVYVFWSCPSKDHPGTPTMFIDSLRIHNRKENLAYIDW